MLNQFKEEVETYPEEDGKSHCTLCGTCVDGLNSHTCSYAQAKHDAGRSPINRGPYDNFDDEAAWADVLHERQR